MGMNSPRIYFDSCIIIYLVEEHPAFSPLIEHRLQNSPGITICFSALSEMECLIMPLRTENQILTDKFQRWFTRAEFLPLDRAVFQAAANLRAAHPTLKTPDALHLATAIHHECSELWTNDDRLDACAPGLSLRIA